MNKNQITMAAIGGVALVAVLAAGYLAYSAWAEKGEKAEDLESAQANVRRINSSAIAPRQESVAAIDANSKLLEEWRAQVLALASAGDLAEDPAATPESFKRKMVTEAAELAKLPGGVEGSIVRSDFDFGFKDYILGGSMPSREQLKAVQRQWAEVGMFVKLLSRCGVREIKSIAVGAAVAATPPEEEPKRGGRNARKNAKPEAEVREPATAQGYTIEFTAMPAAFVRAIDACTMVERFIVVDGFSFAKTRDTLREKLEGQDGKSEVGGGRRPRRESSRRRPLAIEAEPAQEGAEESGKKGLVTDPELDEPLAVTLKLKTYDFGTAASAAAEPGPEAEKEVAE